MNELAVATKAAKEAGAILKDRFQDANPVTLKKDKTFVTESDHLSEQKIISIIKASFPDHSINAEESGFSDQNSEFLWVIDPLDGTTNYATKLPFFAVSIAFVKGDSLEVGVVYDPIHDNLYAAEKGNGATLNVKAIEVSGQGDLAFGMIGYARPKAHKDYLINIFSKVEKISRTPKILGSMALQLALVSSGALDATILVRPNPWDAAAGALIVKEAGGTVSDFEDNDWGLNSENLLASNGKIHEELLKAIR